MHEFREPSFQRIRSTPPDMERAALYRRAARIAVAGNLTLALAKGVAAVLSGSTAILASAIDSTSDLLYTLFMAWGLSRSQKPADENHPQGHARIEPVVSAVIALMMGVAGVEVVRQAVDRLVNGAALFDWGIPVVVLTGSALVKVIMYSSVRRLGKQAHSPAILASAADNLADVISAGTALAGVLAANWIHPLADPLAAIAVSIWIFRNAGGILLENLGYLTGRAAAPELLAQIYRTAAAIEGVVGVHRVIADYVGPQVRAELHVEVDGGTPFNEAHRISNAVRDAVQALDEVDLAFVHLEPAPSRPGSPS